MKKILSVILVLNILFLSLSFSSSALNEGAVEVKVNLPY